MMRLILFFLFVIFSGCTHYRVGVSPTNAVPSIYIESVKNSSLCPKASGTLTAQLAKEIQTSTSLKLVKRNEANSYLKVEIVDFSQRSSAYDPKDTAIVLSVSLRVAAECTLMHRDGRCLWERQRVEAILDLEKQEDFHALRDQAIPQLMERLARKICSLLGNIW